MTLTKEQLELRKKGLGGSEIAAVAGIHPYLTALDVYLEKIGLKEDLPNRYKEWGDRLESALGLAYADRIKLPLEPQVGYSVDVLDRPKTLVHPTESWILATPDFILRQEAEPRGLECKVRGAYDAHRWGPDGTDQVPDEVAAQCHWGMMVTGFTRWDIAVLLGGNDFRVYTLRYEADVAKHLRELGRVFWFNHVVTETPPALDGSKSADHFVKKLFPMHDALMIDGTPEHDALCNQLRMARREFKEAEAVYNMWCARVKAAIGEHAGILGRDYKVTWKRSKDGEAINWKALAQGLLQALPPAQQKQLVSIQTNDVPGSRRFLQTFPGEKDDDE